MRIAKIDRAREFIDYLLHDATFSPDTVIDAAARGRRGFVFRGQRDVSWSLLPAAHRPRCDWHSFTPQGPGKPFVPSEKRLQNSAMNLFLGAHLHAEARSVLLFLESADRLGITTPLDYHQFIASHDAKIRPLLESAGFRRDPKRPERVIVPQEARTLGEQLKQFPDEATLPSYGLAQHYGVPTRLLDWSESPLVAAYFAARGALVAEQGPATFGVLVLDTEPCARNRVPVRIVVAPRHANRNLLAQRGLFTYVPDANAKFRKERRWPSVNELFASTEGYDDALSAVTLPTSEAAALLRILWRLDVTDHHMMPTLEKASSAMAYARTIFPKWS